MQVVYSGGPRKFLKPGQRNRRPKVSPSSARSWAFGARYARHRQQEAMLRLHKPLRLGASVLTDACAPSAPPLCIVMSLAARGNKSRRHQELQWCSRGFNAAGKISSRQQPALQSLAMYCYLVLLLFVHQLAKKTAPVTVVAVACWSRTGYSLFNSLSCGPVLGGHD